MSFRSLVKAFVPSRLLKQAGPAGHLVEAVFYNIVNGFPGRGLKVIGVTGTNGKTSTCFLIHRMMHEAGYKVGLMTTVGYGVGDNIRPQIHHYTNVPVPEFMKRLKQMKKEGAQWLVLETTSHALAQHRVWGIPYSVAVMTNVTHEHLDYHGTFEHYRDAKLKLFKMAAKNSKGLQVGVYNADDSSANLFKSAVPKPLGYGFKNGGLQVKKVKSTSTGSNFELSGGIYRSDEVNGEIGEIWDGVSYTKDTLSDDYHLRVNLPGSFNVMNAAAAAAVGLSIGLTKEQVKQGIAALKSVEGRMTSIDEGQDFSVVVDYAHTPDSFEKLFKDFGPTVKGKLIVMFGSAGGQRDSLKRPVQGELAGKYADEVILTEEDDRDTPGMEILDQIAAGVQKAGKVRNKNLFLVLDRTEAIKFTLGRAKAGDMVLLLGKGHEKTIERGDREDPWDEIGTAREVLRGLSLGKDR